MKKDYPDFNGHVKDLEIIDQANLKWFHYVFCGYKAIQETYGLEETVGMNLFVTGNIPMGAGLSSSSALVVCSALAFLHGNKLTEKADRTALGRFSFSKTIIVLRIEIKIHKSQRMCKS